MGDSQTVSAKKGLMTKYDQSVGLRKLLEKAVGNVEPRYMKLYIDDNITEEYFPLAKVGPRIVRLWVEPYLKDETSEQAAQRLVAGGYTLASLSALAGFAHDHADEVKRWVWIFALSEDSRWKHPRTGSVLVPHTQSYAVKYPDFHISFKICPFQRKFDSHFGILVEGEL